MTEVVTFL